MRRLVFLAFALAACGRQEAQPRVDANPPQQTSPVVPGGSNNGLGARGTYQGSNNTTISPNPATPDVVTNPYAVPTPAGGLPQSGYSGPMTGTGDTDTRNR